MIPSKSPRAGSAPALSFIFAMTLRSMPPAKSFLPEVRITPLTAGSASAASISASSSAMPVRLRTFIDFPGTSQVIVAMPSASVAEVKSVICGLPWQASRAGGFAPPDPRGVFRPE